MLHQENMTNICLHEALNVINEAISMPRELDIHTACVISSVLTQDKSQTKTMKNDLGIYVSSLTITFSAASSMRPNRFS